MGKPVEPRKEARGARRPLPMPTGRYCPKCGAMLLKRPAAHGVFIACANYPMCQPGVVGTRHPVKLTRKG